MAQFGHSRRHSIDQDVAPVVCHSLGIVNGIGERGEFICALDIGLAPESRQIVGVQQGFCRLDKGQEVGQPGVRQIDVTCAGLLHKDIMRLAGDLQIDLRRVIRPLDPGADLAFDRAAFLVGDDDGEFVIDDIRRIGAALIVVLAGHRTIQRLRVAVRVIKVIFDRAGIFVDVQPAISALLDSLHIMVAVQFQRVAGCMVVGIVSIRRTRLDTACIDIAGTMGKVADDGAEDEQRGGVGPSRLGLAKSIIGVTKTCQDLLPAARVRRRLAGICQPVPLLTLDTLAAVGNSAEGGCEGGVIGGRVRTGKITLCLNGGDQGLGRDRQIGDGLWLVGILDQEVVQVRRVVQIVADTVRIDPVQHAADHADPFAGRVLHPVARGCLVPVAAIGAPARAGFLHRAKRQGIHHIHVCRRLAHHQRFRIAARVAVDRDRAVCFAPDDELNATLVDVQGDNPVSPFDHGDAVALGKAVVVVQTLREHGNAAAIGVGHAVRQLQRPVGKNDDIVIPVLVRHIRAEGEADIAVIVGCRAPHRAGVFRPAEAEPGGIVILAKDQDTKGHGAGISALVILHIDGEQLIGDLMLGNGVGTRLDKLIAPGAVHIEGQRAELPFIGDSIAGPAKLTAAIDAPARRAGDLLAIGIVDLDRPFGDVVGIGDRPCAGCLACQPGAHRALIACRVRSAGLCVAIDGTVFPQHLHRHEPARGCLLRSARRLQPDDRNFLTGDRIDPRRRQNIAGIRTSRRNLRGHRLARTDRNRQVGRIIFAADIDIQVAALGPCPFLVAHLNHEPVDQPDIFGCLLDQRLVADIAIGDLMLTIRRVPADGDMKRAILPGQREACALADIEIEPVDSIAHVRRGIARIRIIIAVGRHLLALVRLDAQALENRPAVHVDHRQRCFGGDVEFAFRDEFAAIRADADLRRVIHALEADFQLDVGLGRAALRRGVADGDRKCDLALVLGRADLAIGQLLERPRQRIRLGREGHPELVRIVVVSADLGNFIGSVVILKPRQTIREYRAIDVGLTDARRDDGESLGDHRIAGDIHTGVRIGQLRVAKCPFVTEDRRDWPFVSVAVAVPVDVEVTNNQVQRLGIGFRLRRAGSCRNRLLAALLAVGDPDIDLVGLADRLGLKGRHLRRQIHIALQLDPAAVRPHLEIVVVAVGALRWRDGFLACRLERGIDRCLVQRAKFIVRGSQDRTQQVDQRRHIRIGIKARVAGLKVVECRAEDTAIRKAGVVIRLVQVRQCLKGGFCRRHLGVQPCRRRLDQFEAEFTILDVIDHAKGGVEYSFPVIDPGHRGLARQGTRRRHQLLEIGGIAADTGDFSFETRDGGVQIAANRTVIGGGKIGVVRRVLHRGGPHLKRRDEVLDDLAKGFLIDAVKPDRCLFLGADPVREGLKIGRAVIHRRDIHLQGFLRGILISRPHDEVEPIGLVGRGRRVRAKMDNLHPLALHLFKGEGVALADIDPAHAVIGFLQLHMRGVGVEHRLAPQPGKPGHREGDIAVIGQNLLGLRDTVLRHRIGVVVILEPDHRHGQDFFHIAAAGHAFGDIELQRDIGLTLHQIVIDIVGVDPFGADMRAFGGVARLVVDRVGIGGRPVIVRPDNQPDEMRLIAVEGRRRMGEQGLAAGGIGKTGDQQVDMRVDIVAELEPHILREADMAVIQLLQREAAGPVPVGAVKHLNDTCRPAVDTHLAVRSDIGDVGPRIRTGIFSGPRLQRNGHLRCWRIDIHDAEHGVCQGDPALPLGKRGLRHVLGKGTGAVIGCLHRVVAVGIGAEIVLVVDERPVIRIGNGGGKGLVGAADLALPLDILIVAELVGEGRLEGLRLAVLQVDAGIIAGMHIAHLAIEHILQGEMPVGADMRVGDRRDRLPAAVALLYLDPARLLGLDTFLIGIRIATVTMVDCVGIAGDDVDHIAGADIVPVRIRRIQMRGGQDQRRALFQRPGLGRLLRHLVDIAKHDSDGLAAGLGRAQHLALAVPDKFAFGAGQFAKREDIILTAGHRHGGEGILVGINLGHQLDRNLAVVVNDKERQAVADIGKICGDRSRIKGQCYRCWVGGNHRMPVFTAICMIEHAAIMGDRQLERFRHLNHFINTRSSSHRCHRRGVIRNHRGAQSSPGRLVEGKGLAARHAILVDKLPAGEGIIRAGIRQRHRVSCGFALAVRDSFALIAGEAVYSHRP